jgi:two-component system sensor histidine kinase KdpD
VEELLQAGISVYTTVNVQHIESLNDIVHQITRVRMQETVPDRLLSTAEAVELVDLPPEKLLERFAEGKVYVPAKAEQAMRRFFREGNLLALRELALRYTARHVDEDMRSYMVRHGILGPWHTGSRLLVCVSSSPTSEQLIRDAHRMASELDAEWFAVHVDWPAQGRMSEADRDSLARNLRLADQLGGKVVALTGNRVAHEIISFARAKNVTLILVGGSLRSRWQELIRGSIINQIIRQSGSIHVLVVGVGRPPERKTQRIAQPKRPDWHPIRDTILTVAGATSVCWLAKDLLEFVNIAMIMLLPVAISGMFWGRRAGLIASILAVACLDFFFVPPYYTFRVSDIRLYLPSFLVFFAVGLITSFLGDLVRLHAESGRQRAYFLSALYTFSRDLFAVRGLDDLLSHATRAISEAFQCGVIILLPKPDGRLRVEVQRGDSAPFDDREFGVATWVFQHGQAAGRGTDTLSSAARCYLPLRALHGVVGVLGVRPEGADVFLSPDQWRLLDAITNVIALSIVRSSPAAE